MGRRRPGAGIVIGHVGDHGGNVSGEAGAVTGYSIFINSTLHLLTIRGGIAIRENTSARRLATDRAI
jgi:hypothetical protein